MSSSRAIRTVHVVLPTAQILTQWRCVWCESGRMGIRLGSTVVNCADLETMTDFWTQALGLPPNHRDPGDDFRVLRGGRVNMSLQVASTPVSARDQMHLDLYSDDPEAQVARIIALGAKFVRENARDQYVVLVDPEGNEFCVCTVDQI